MFLGFPARNTIRLCLSGNKVKYIHMFLCLISVGEEYWVGSIFSRIREWQHSNYCTFVNVEILFAVNYHIRCFSNFKLNPAGLVLGMEK